MDILPGIKSFTSSAAKTFLETTKEELHKQGGEALSITEERLKEIGKKNVDRIVRAFYLSAPMIASALLVLPAAIFLDGKN